MTGTAFGLSMPSDQGQGQGCMVANREGARLPVVDRMTGFAGPAILSVGQLGTMRFLMAVPAGLIGWSDLNPGASQIEREATSRILEMAPVAANLPMPAFQGISARLMIRDGVSCRLEAPFIMAGPAIDHPSCESCLPRMRILMASAATLERGLRSPCTLRIVTVSTLELTMLPLQWIPC